MSLFGNRDDTLLREFTNIYIDRFVRTACCSRWLNFRIG